MPGKVVADASVLAAVTFLEDRAEEARSVLSDAELYAPHLLAYELASVARKQILRDRSQTQAILEVLAGALVSPILWSPVDYAATVRLAMSEGISTYDASYLFLARSLGIPLVTFDDRLSRAANRSV